MAEIPPISCPKCDKKFKTKADVRGKRIKCPFCTESFVVPGGEGDSSTAVQEKAGSAPSSAQEKAQPAAVRGDNGEAPENDNPYGVTDLDLAPRCPNCANEMESADAVVCLTCGYNTLTREWGKVEKTLGVSFGRQMMYLLPAFLSLLCLINCIVGRLIENIYMPYWVAEWQVGPYVDHESTRMWGTMMALIGILFAGRYCFNRFIVKPIPDEVKVEE